MLMLRVSLPELRMLLSIAESVKPFCALCGAVRLNAREFTRPEFTNSMHGARNPDTHTEKSEFRVGDKLG